jgi:hypothetical protein
MHVQKCQFNELFAQTRFALLNIGMQQHCLTCRLPQCAALQPLSPGAARKQHVHNALVIIVAYNHERRVTIKLHNLALNVLSKHIQQTLLLNSVARQAARAV